MTSGLTKRIARDAKAVVPHRACKFVAYSREEFNSELAESASSFVSLCSGHGPAFSALGVT